MGDIRRSVGWCAVALAALAACGGDDDASGGGVVTGLPAEQKLSTLSDDDVKKACRSVNESAAVVITPTAIARATCLSVGVQAGLTITGDKVSVDVSKCQQAVDKCVSETKEEVSYTNEDDCDSASSKDVEDCDATVGELETCFDLMLRQMQQQLSKATCQNAENLASEEYANELDPENIPECKSLRTKCPDTQLGIPFEDSDQSDQSE